MINYRHIKVEGVPSLVRDVETNAILSVDAKAIELARTQKRIRAAKKIEHTALENKVDSLQKDIEDIKKILELLVSDNV
mgnify:CR=1 FL=1|tara:strand:- start:5727 stop:5963 length:237 start_codon:yes stop_codon:yes gene_type:complete